MNERGISLIGRRTREKDAVAVKSIGARNCAGSTKSPPNYINVYQEIIISCVYCLQCMVTEAC